MSTASQIRCSVVEFQPLRTMVRVSLQVTRCGLQQHENTQRIMINTPYKEIDILASPISDINVIRCIANTVQELVPTHNPNHSSATATEVRQATPVILGNLTEFYIRKIRTAVRSSYLSNYHQTGITRNYQPGPIKHTKKKTKNIIRKIYLQTPARIKLISCCVHHVIYRPLGALPASCIRTTVIPCLLFCQVFPRELTVRR